MNTKKLLQSGFIYTIGNLLVQGLAFITLPIYTGSSQQKFMANTVYMLLG